MYLSDLTDDEWKFIDADRLDTSFLQTPFTYSFKQRRPANTGFHISPEDQNRYGYSHYLFHYSGIPSYPHIRPQLSLWS